MGDIWGPKGHRDVAVASWELVLVLVSSWKVRWRDTGGHRRNLVGQEGTRGGHGDLAAASWELVAISMASWTLRCRASRVRWSTGSTLWMSTLVTTSPLGAKRSFSRSRPASSKPNTAEQMRRLEFWGQEQRAVRRLGTSGSPADTEDVGAPGTWEGAGEHTRLHQSQTWLGR